MDFCTKALQRSNTGPLLTNPRIEPEHLTLKTLVILLRNYQP